MRKMKVKDKNTGKVYEYNYSCILFNEDVADTFKQKARELKLTNSQYLEKLLNGGK